MTIATDATVLSCDEAVAQLAQKLKKNLSREEFRELVRAGSDVVERMAEALCNDYLDGGSDDLKEVIRKGFRSSDPGTLKSAFRESLRKLRRDSSDTSAAKKGRVAS